MSDPESQKTADRNPEHQGEGKWSREKIRLLVVQSGGDWSGGALLSWHSWLFKPIPRQKKIPFFQELKRGLKSTAQSWNGGQKARKTLRGILAVGRACHRPGRGCGVEDIWRFRLQAQDSLPEDQVTRFVLDGVEKCWKEGAECLWIHQPFPSPLEFFRVIYKSRTVMSFVRQEDGDLVGGVSFLRGEAPITWSKDAVDQGRVKTLPFFAEQASARLVGASHGIQFFLARYPYLRPRKTWGRLHKPGGCSLGLANSRFFQRLCSAKLRMCLARNPSLIFKPLCIFF